MKINLTKIKDNGNEPRVHGNGFIQLDISNKSRLHIWGHPDIPKQAVSTPIHDHRFSFKSTVLVGRLVNITYTFNYNNDFPPKFSEHEAICRQGEDTILTPTGRHGIVVERTTTMIDDWDIRNVYHMEKGIFHELLPCVPSATICTKTANSPNRIPRVLVPFGITPDNDFNRYESATTEDLWKIIYTVLKGRYI